MAARFDVNDESASVCIGDALVKTFPVARLPPTRGNPGSSQHDIIDLLQVFAILYEHCIAVLLTGVNERFVNAIPPKNTQRNDFQAKWESAS